jgi:hypothetical protein
MNPRGQVTFTDDGRGNSKEFKYRPNGELVEVRGMDGSHWHKTRPGEWVDNNGRRFRGEIAGVDKNGNAHYVPEGGRPFIHTIDGRVVPENGDSRDRHPTRDSDRPPETAMANARAVMLIVRRKEGLRHLPKQLVLQFRERTRRPELRRHQEPRRRLKLPGLSSGPRVKGRPRLRK